MIRRQGPGVLVAASAWAGLGGLVAAGSLAMGPAALAAAGVAVGLLLARRVADKPLLGAATRASEPAPGDALVRAVGATLLDRLPAPVVVLDSQGRILRANATAAEILGDDPVNRPLAAFLRAPVLLDAVDRVRAGSALEIIDLNLRVPVERHLEVHLARMDGATGKRGALLLVFHDMTAVRRAERLRADFVANASHELKTPLTVLSGFIETLEGPAKDDAQARVRFLSIMREQATRMGRLVNDLLSLSRIELNEHLAPRDLVDVGSVLRDVADGLSMLAGQSDMTIEVDLPPDYPSAYGEREEVVQVAQNLIDNAIKYGRPGTAISVSLSEQATPPRVVLAVRDRGEGIAREHIPRLTERFYRIDAVRSRERGGTGLGLAIVKHIVNRHRGQLTIDSVLGEGSVFTVALPAAPGGRLTAPRGAAASPAANPANAAGPTNKGGAADEAAPAARRAPPI